MIQTTVPLLAHYDFYYSHLTVGILSAVFGLATFVTTTLINPYLSVRVRRIAFISSAFAFSFVLLLFFFTTSLMLWPLTAASGAVTGFMMPNIVTSASLFSDRRVRERVISLYTTALSISLVMGPSLEAYILNYFSLRYAFLFFVPFGIVATVLSPFIKFPQEDQTRKRQKFKINRGFSTSVLINLSYNIPYIVITVFAGIYAHTYLNASYSAVTLYYSIFYTTSFLSRLILSVKNPAHSLGLAVAATIALTAAGLSLMYIATGSLMFGIAMAVLGIPHGLSFPVSLLYISRSYEPEKRNSANSYFFSIATVIMVSGPVVGGYAIQILGFRTLFLLMLPIVAVLSVFIYLKGRDL